MHGDSLPDSMLHHRIVQVYVSTALVREAFGIGKINIRVAFVALLSLLSAETPLCSNRRELYYPLRCNSPDLVHSSRIVPARPERATMHSWWCSGWNVRRQVCRRLSYVMKLKVHKKKIKNVTHTRCGHRTAVFGNEQNVLRCTWTLQLESSAMTYLMCVICRSRVRQWCHQFVTDSKTQ
jgi:hypothetical protein